jgi:glycosyltransferase involved in cell wall biosynthesis
VDSLADDGLPNAQMGNAREIVCCLDPECFHVSIFGVGRPDARILARRNTHVVRLPRRRQTPRILREFILRDYDVLFYLKASPASNWYLRLRKKWKDRRCTVGTVESQADLRKEPTLAPKAVALWEQTVLRCDRLYSNSTSVQKSLRQNYGIESAIIPTGVNTRFFFPRWERAQNSRPRVLFVGSLRRYKQPHVLVDAAERCPEADFRLAGDGPLAGELAEAIARRELRNISLLGPLSQEQLRTEYQNADVFLFPSRWEGSPKVILEAAACGVAIIARKDYSAETVEHGKTGYMGSSNEELLSYLRGLLANPALRAEFGRNARKLAERYDWSVITAEWEREFTNIVEEQKRRRAS